MLSRAKRSPLGKCCPLLELVLSRKGSSLSIDPMWAPGSADVTEILRVTFKRGKAPDPHAAVTYAICDYCPFCGTKLRREPAK